MLVDFLDKVPFHSCTSPNYIGKLYYLSKKIISLILIALFTATPIFASLNEVVVIINNDGKPERYVISKQFPVVVMVDKISISADDLNTARGSDGLYYTLLPDKTFQRLELLFSHDHLNANTTPISKISYNIGDTNILTRPIDDNGEFHVSFPDSGLLKIAPVTLSTRIPYFSILIGTHTKYYINKDLLNSKEKAIQTLTAKAKKKNGLGEFTMDDLLTGFNLGHSFKSSDISHLTIFNPFKQDMGGMLKSCSTIHYNKEILDAGKMNLLSAPRSLFFGDKKTPLLGVTTTGQEHLRNASNIFITTQPLINDGILNEEVLLGFPNQAIDDKESDEDEDESNFIIEKIEKLEFRMVERKFAEEHWFIRQYHKTRSLPLLFKVKQLALTNENYPILLKAHHLIAQHYLDFENDTEKALKEIGDGESFFPNLIKEGYSQIEKCRLIQQKGYLTKSESAFNEAMKIAESLNFSDLIVKVLLIKAKAMGDMSSALKALEISKESKSSDSIAACYSCLGILEPDIYKEASFFRQAEKYARESCNPRLLAKVLSHNGNNQATIARREQDDKRETLDKDANRVKGLIKTAFKYHQEAFEIYQEIGDQSNQAEMKLSMSHLFECEKDRRRYCEEALKLVPENNFKLRLKILTSAVNVSQDVLEKAQGYAEEFFRLNKDKPNHNVFKALGAVYSRHGKKLGQNENDREGDIRFTKKAIKYHLKALKAANIEEEKKETLEDLKYTMNNLVLTTSFLSDNLSSPRKLGDLIENLERHIIDQTKDSKVLFSAHMQIAYIYNRLAKINKNDAIEDIKNSKSALKSLVKAQGYIQRNNDQEEVKLLENELLFVQQKISSAAGRCIKENRGSFPKKARDVIRALKMSVEQVYNKNDVNRDKERYYALMHLIHLLEAKGDYYYGDYYYKDDKKKQQQCFEEALCYSQEWTALNAYSFYFKNNVKQNTLTIKRLEDKVRELEDNDKNTRNKSSNQEENTKYATEKRFKKH